MIIFPFKERSTNRAVLEPLHRLQSVPLQEPLQSGSLVEPTHPYQLNMVAEFPILRLLIIVIIHVVKNFIITY